MLNWLRFGIIFVGMDVLIMTNAQAWDYSIGMIKVDGLEPTEDFKNIWKERGSYGANEGRKDPRRGDGGDPLVM